MNEKPELQAWLDYFKENPFDGELEIIVSDNESTDGTIELAKQNACKVVVTPRNEFSYPKSLNVGIALATNKFVASVVAHAYPLRKDWLANGLRHFDNPKVVGVFGPTFPSKSAALAEWIFYGTGFLGEKLRGKRLIKKTSLGVFGATNLIIRKSVWEKHHFDEAFGGGGEDTQWAKWAFENGYYLVTDPKFSVRHSHGLKLKSFIEQYRHWKKWIKPEQFDRDKIKYKKHLRYEDRNSN